jgi:uncharacterized protein YeaO (DUF488 family)
MIKTKSINDPVEESDGIRILVTRYPVRKQRNIPPFIMEWWKDMAPSAELLNDWREKRISWKEYETRYLQEMSGEHQQEKIKELAMRTKHETITLLCFEPEGDPHCHRHLLKKLIKGCK